MNTQFLLSIAEKKRSQRNIKNLYIEASVKGKGNEKKNK
jgi:hypothetical protein